MSEGIVNLLAQFMTIFGLFGSITKSSLHRLLALGHGKSSASAFSISQISYSGLSESCDFAKWRVKKWLLKFTVVSRSTSNGRTQQGQMPAFQRAGGNLAALQKAETRREKLKGRESKRCFGGVAWGFAPDAGKLGSKVQQDATVLTPEIMLPLSREPRRIGCTSTVPHVGQWGLECGSPGKGETFRYAPRRRKEKIHLAAQRNKLRDQIQYE